ncbi:hypothetical protein N7462_000754 [Penicillium macrosclerotiorum]|uniref:uncharacterized protein n=1 Tax=Penicillium macrosclerotiorum TaxID=303699 RepID=UPI002548EBC2|nr:uncharacterized protein N7462_000754 [Penicillium macrosclerotiorum]KAJ5698749.1 hypothetical protein N7462_000754 [Penicillium macrosclerotiorum]
MASPIPQPRCINGPPYGSMASWCLPRGTIIHHHPSSLNTAPAPHRHRTDTALTPHQRRPWVKIPSFLLAKTRYRDLSLEPEKQPPLPPTVDHPGLDPGAVGVATWIGRSFHAFPSLGPWRIRVRSRFPSAPCPWGNDASWTQSPGI